MSGHHCLNITEPSPFFVIFGSDVAALHDVAIYGFETGESILDVYSLGAGVSNPVPTGNDGDRMIGGVGEFAFQFHRAGGAGANHVHVFVDHSNLVQIAKPSPFFIVFRSDVTVFDYDAVLAETSLNHREHSDGIVTRLDVGTEPVPTSRQFGSLAGSSSFSEAEVVNIEIKSPRRRVQYCYILCACWHFFRECFPLCNAGDLNFIEPFK